MTTEMMLAVVFTVLFAIVMIMMVFGLNALFPLVGMFVVVTLAPLMGLIWARGLMATAS